jgi:hypothetical protein
MPGSWVLTPPYFLTFAFLCGVVGFRMGWRTKSRLALPLLQGTLGWIAFLIAWSFLGAFWATACVGAWSVGSTLASVYVFLGKPRETDVRVIRATEYRATMLEWLSTGRGPEAHPAGTAVQHLRELIWYVAAATASANLLSLVMGAILLNYMNAYVATLLRAANRTGRALLLAWNVWSVVRVAAYVAIGAAAGAPVLRLMGYRVDSVAVRSLAVVGAGGVVLDLVLKLMLSRPCGRALASAIDLEAAKANRSSELPLELHLD